MFNDVMTSFRDVIPSCKYDNNNKVEFKTQRNYRSENGISSRAHLQAKKKKVSFLTSCSDFNDVMTSRHDKMTSCNYIYDNSLELSNRNIYINISVSPFYNIDELIYEQ